MGTDKLVYPPCDLRRVDGIYARCNDPSRAYYGCIIGPIQCQLCLADPLRHSNPRPTPAKKQRSTRRTVSENSQPVDPPSLIQRAFSYAEALARWVAAGRPERTDKEVEQLFRQHCKPCKWFDRKRQICLNCGCRVADSGFAILNKIKMATEHCPRELW